MTLLAWFVVAAAACLVSAVACVRAANRCPPIPARGRPGIWRWEP